MPVFAFVIGFVAFGGLLVASWADSKRAWLEKATLIDRAFVLLTALWLATTVAQIVVLLVEPDLVPAGVYFSVGAVLLGPAVVLWGVALWRNARVGRGGVLSRPRTVGVVKQQAVLAAAIGASFFAFGLLGFVLSFVS